MSNYHITQEQAFQLMHLAEIPVVMNKFMELKYLERYANAALDRVLGEQWISVADRLPEHTLYSDTPLDDGYGKPIPPLYKSERVLSLDEYGTVYIGKLDIMEGKVIPKITHWMPLTKLYAPKELP